jgi:O-antigen ligase
MRPVETAPATAIVVCLVVLALLPWAWSRTEKRSLVSFMVGLSAIGLVLAGSITISWDRESALGQIGLAAVTAAVVWIASRATPSPRFLRAWALLISLLALWAVWQTAFGFDLAMDQLELLPEHLQHNAQQRLAGGRAFGPLLLPGHLAVMLASAFPVLVTGLRRSAAGVACAVGVGLCVVGLWLTSSPVGIGLATCAGLALVIIRRSEWKLQAALVALAVVAALSLSARSDVRRLEPVRLRIDNARTALWLASTSPLCGVGLGSYGQASRAVPFEVGNRPAHAHNMVLEWLAELGVIGAALWLLLMLWLGRLALALRRDHPWAAIALVFVPLHNLVDFSLYTAGVAIPWAVLAGGCAALARPAAQVERRAPGRAWAVAAASLAVAGSILLTVSVDAERTALGMTEPVQRAETLRIAHRIAPWRMEPALGIAAAALESHDPERMAEALRMVAARRWLRPSSGSLASACTELDLGLGAVHWALAESWAAFYAQPYLESRRERFEQLATGGRSWPR